MNQNERSIVKRIHLANFNIAGFSYWDGCEAFNELKIGTELEFVREPGNEFDPYAVAIYYKDFKLGFIPRRENHDIANYIDMGLGGIYEVRVQRLSPELEPEEQVGVVVYIKNQQRG